MFAPKRQISDRLLCLLIHFLFLTLLTEKCPGLAGMPLPQRMAFAVSMSNVIDTPVSILTSRPGNPVRREMTAGQSHIHEISVDANQFLRVTVVPRGLRIQVAVFDPDGKRLSGDSVPNDTMDSLLVSVIAAMPGKYRVEVRSLEKREAGSYEINIAELRPPAPGDESRVEAERLFSRGVELLNSGTAESTRRAIEHFEEVFAQSQKLKNQEQGAIALLNIGQSYNYLGEPKKAIEYYERALNLMPDAVDRSKRALALNFIGSIYLNIGENQKA